MAITKKDSDKPGYVEKFKKVKTILVSQARPPRTPYSEIEERYGLQIDFRPFIQVDPLSEKDFRKTRIRPEEYRAVIFNSKHAIDHFFRITEEMRVKMHPDTRYFCATENVANYLQKFILFRKRKVFNGIKSIEDIQNYFVKFRTEKFLLICSNLGAQDTIKMLDKIQVEYTEAIMYHTVSSDLSDLSDITYDVLVFFTPLEIKSLYDNFPDFKQNQTRIAVFGSQTIKAAEEKGLIINIKAPTPEAPSMTMALANYMAISNESK